MSKSDSTVETRESIYAAQKYVIDSIQNSGLLEHQKRSLLLRFDAAFEIMYSEVEKGDSHG